MDITVLAGSAEQLVFDLLEPAPRERRRRRHRSRAVEGARSWYREERAAYQALVQARESGDLQLVQGAQRAHAETWKRAPVSCARRRRTGR